jgi:hypothetical protein
MGDHITSMTHKSWPLQFNKMPGGSQTHQLSLSDVTKSFVTNGDVITWSDTIHISETKPVRLPLGRMTNNDAIKITRFGN